MFFKTGLVAVFVAVAVTKAAQVIAGRRIAFGVVVLSDGKTTPCQETPIV
jgi:hypothetical protein